MTGFDLARIARDAIPPVGATDLCLVVEVTEGGRLSNGEPAGIGVTSRYGVAWVIDGRAKSAPIATFGRHAEAMALMDLLTGPALRSGPGRGVPPAPERTRPAASPATEDAAAPQPAADPGAGPRGGDDQLGFAL
jgi:hypothetical protein